MIKILTLILAISTLTSSFTVSTPTTDLDAQLANLRDTRHLMGLQLQITNKTHVLYHGNFGLKDEVKPIKNQTMFRIASCSKSFAAASVMLLVQENKVALNQSLSSIFGFTVRNPSFPNVDITVQMALSHQSSLIECDPYYTNFLMDTYNAKSGYQIPPIKQILTQGGKYFNKCLYSSTYPPGTHYQYVNLNFGLAGAIVQKISGIRFDIFVRERITKYISVGLPEVATFDVSTISNPENLGVCYTGSNGKWVPQVDNYPTGKIPVRNLTGYVVGSNGVVFGPQGGLRASVSHLSNYITMIANKGVTKQGTRVLSTQSVNQMLKPRYQYHGSRSGSQNDFHLYGFGLYTTTYRKNDIVIPHEVVRGHTGSAYGLISGYYFWGNYTMTYIVNGALNGYGYGTGTIYQRERLMIYEAVRKFVVALGEKND